MELDYMFISVHYGNTQNVLTLFAIFIFMVKIGIK